jgi:hypothetical protein
MNAIDEDLEQGSVPCAGCHWPEGSTVMGAARRFPRHLLDQSRVPCINCSRELRVTVISHGDGAYHALQMALSQEVERQGLFFIGDGTGECRLAVGAQMVAPKQAKIPIPNGVLYLGECSYCQSPREILRALPHR